jgi:hypothetical protein
MGAVEPFPIKLKRLGESSGCILKASFFMGNPRGVVWLSVAIGLAVFVIALVVGGVVYLNVQSNSTRPAPVNKIFTDTGQTDSQNSSQTKTYTNSQYKFNFEYPGDLEVVSGADGVLKIDLPKSDSVLSGYMHMYIHADSDGSCLKIPKGSPTMSVEGGYFVTRINGAPFTTYSTYIEGGENPDLIAVDNFYKTVHNNICYSIIIGGQGSLKNGAGGRDPRTTALAEVYDKLDIVASSFRFTDAYPSVRDYTGSWFKIEYPSDFISRPPTTADEAFFTSPDGSVEFYIYSPYTYGTTSYQNPLPKETVLSDTSKTENIQNIQQNYLSPRITRWITFAAKDGSYKRSLVSIKEGVFDQPNQYGQDAQFSRVFGIKYKDQASYDKYLQQYLAFKKSLVQYAD